MHRFFDAVIAPALERLQPAVVVEIGALAGAMTERLVAYCAERGAVCHSIDPCPAFEVRESASFVFHRALSHEALPRIANIDLVLVDGDHNYHTVRGELEVLAANAERDTRPFPVVMFHDVAWPYGRRDSYHDPATVPEEFRQPFAQRGMRPGHRELMTPGAGLNSPAFNAQREGGPRNGVKTAIEDFTAQSARELAYFEIPVLHGLGILHPVERAEELGPLLDSFSLSKPLAALLAAAEADRLAHLIRAEELGRRLVVLEAERSVPGEEREEEAPAPRWLLLWRGLTRSARGG